MVFIFGYLKNSKKLFCDGKEKNSVLDQELELQKSLSRPGDIVVREEKCLCGCIKIFTICILHFVLLTVSLYLAMEIVIRLNCQQKNVNDNCMLDRSRMIVTETNGSLLRFIYVMLAANNTDNYSNSVQRKVLSLHNPSVPPKRPVANLFLDIKSSNQEKKLLWTRKHNSTVSSVTNNVHYRNGSLIATMNGVYMIYNTLSIKSQHHPNKERLTHKMTIKRKENPKNQRVLFQKEVSRVGGELVYQMTDMISIVKLKAGDVLLVDISNISAIYEESWTSLFGLFMIRY